MLRKIVGVLSVLVIGGAIVLFFALERVNTEHLDMDAAARVHAPGLFVELSDGVTHYDEAGPASRQTVILIHGFSVPYYIWDTTYVALVEGEVGDRVGAQLRAGVDLDDGRAVVDRFTVNDVTTGRALVAHAEVILSRLAEAQAGAVRAVYLEGVTYADLAAREGFLLAGLSRTNAPLAVILTILVIYLLLGCMLEGLSMIMLTVPIFYPVVAAQGFDLIWFGIFVVILVEISLITPPVGLNVFVLNSTFRDIGLPTIFRGVLPFVTVDILRLILLIVFPALVLFLPESMN